MLTPEILEEVCGRRVLVTGGTGMIGRQLVARLCSAGARVTVVSLDRLVVDERAQHLRVDLTELSSCLQVCQGQELVAHLAGIKGSASVSNTHLASHFVPTLMFNTNLLEAARRCGVTRLVYTSSIGACSAADVLVEEEGLGNWSGPPLDFAGWAKRMGELQIHAYRQQYGLTGYAVVRPSNVFGPGDNFDPENAMVIPSLLMRLANGERPLKVWGDGTAIRDFVYSKDVADGILLALLRGTKDSYVNLGSGRQTTIRELVETLAEIIPFPFEFEPNRGVGQPQRIMDIGRARDWLGYDPATPLRQALKETWQWFGENRDEYRHKQNYFS